MEKKYEISILLTQYQDILSKFVHYLIDRKYTHASIGLNESEDTYYSFTIKGFRREHPKRHKDKIKKSVCYKIRVTQKQYRKIADSINRFQDNRHFWKYNLPGIFLCKMRIPHRMKWRYFCSQFVTELLQKAEVLERKASPSLFSPSKLERELLANFKLMEIITNPI